MFLSPTKALYEDQLMTVCQNGPIRALAIGVIQPLLSESLGDCVVPHTFRMIYVSERESMVSAFRLPAQQLAQGQDLGELVDGAAEQLGQAHRVEYEGVAQSRRLVDIGGQVGPDEDRLAALDQFPSPPSPLLASSPPARSSLISAQTR